MKHHSNSETDLAVLQEQIDKIPWYHEFDFPDGLRARSKEPDVKGHRSIWHFTESQLDKVDFRGKTVLDIGAWDGYWSFYAERRGASHVVAADDLTQNWSDGKGILLAKELLGSKIEIRQDVSVYEIASLGQKFDIIMCLGVYYHLIDPFLGLAQIRHCCRPETLLLLQGDLGQCGMEPNEVLYNFCNNVQAFIASASAFDGFLESAFLRVQSLVWMYPPPPPKRKRLLRRIFPRRTPRPQPRHLECAFHVCVPFEGINDKYPYKPPFGLHIYDERFRTAPVSD